MTWVFRVLPVAAVVVLAAIFAISRPIPQIGDRLIGILPEAAAVAIFAMTYLVIAIGRLPGFQLDRSGGR